MLSPFLLISEEFIFVIEKNLKMISKSEKKVWNKANRKFEEISVSKREKWVKNAAKHFEVHCPKSNSLTQKILWYFRYNVVINLGLITTKQFVEYHQNVFAIILHCLWLKCPSSIENFFTIARAGCAIYLGKIEDFLVIQSTYSITANPGRTKGWFSVSLNQTFLQIFLKIVNFQKFTWFLVDVQNWTQLVFEEKNFSYFTGFYPIF